MMKTLFWVCFSFVSYAYVGYALWLFVFGRKQPFLRQQLVIPVSIIIAARNEEAGLPRKLANLRDLDYPAAMTQIIIVSDGSTDRTAQILEDQRSGILPILLPTAGGKANSLNQAVRHATGDILIFLDTRQTVDRNAVSELVSCFADTSVGAVSGELLLESAAGDLAGEALGIYWKIEKAIRKLESASGSVIGTTGAIYAIRRELYADMPPGTILDDVFIPMHVARAGKRVVFQPSAIARDRVFPQSGKEFSRKVRTLTGNYQLVSLAPWLLSDANPLLFRFLSHKMSRLFVPLFLVLMLVSSALASGSYYRALFWLQIVFYLLAALGLLAPPFKRFRVVAIANTFVALNLAATLAFYNFVMGRKNVWA